MTENEQFLAGYQSAAKGEAEPEEKPETPAEKPADEGPSREDLLAQLRDAQQRERSVAGRISAVDRSNNQLKEQLAALQRQIAELTASKAVEKPAEPDLLDETPDLKKAIDSRISKADAEHAAKLKTLEDRLAEAEGRVGKAVETVEPLVAETTRREMEQVASTLDKQFPGWQADVFSDMQARTWTPKFQAWVESQPEAIQSLALHGKTVAESTAVLKLFRAEMVKEKPSAQDRLRQAAGIGVSSAATPAENPDDFLAGYRDARARAQR